MIEYSCFPWEYQISWMSYPQSWAWPNISQPEWWVASPQASTSFLWAGKGKCPTPYPQINLEEEIEVYQEQLYEVPQDRVSHSDTYSPISPHFLRVLTREVI